MQPGDSIFYKSNPLNIIKRKIIKFAGRMFIRMFFRFKLIGIENFPKFGPYILAGNHVGSIEALLLVCFAPHIIEVLGASDIPLDPNLAVFAEMYGYIPINRGEIDQKGLKTALGVLESKGMIGIFPEGGIWDSKIKPVKIGVSWLSEKTNSPVIPIGFVGVKNALKRALRFEFPKMQMIVGQPIYPVDLFDQNLSKRERLSEAATYVMNKITDLLPENESQIVDNNHNAKDLLSIQICDNSTDHVNEIILEEIASFSRLLQHPVIMDVFIKNLKMPVQPLLLRNKFQPIFGVLIGCESIDNFLSDKPGFLPYRFGFEDGLKMKKGLNELQSQLRQFSDKKFSIRFSLKE